MYVWAIIRSENSFSQKWDIFVWGGKTVW
jgi:hypothetical protein